MFYKVFVHQRLGHHPNLPGIGQTRPRSQSRSERKTGNICKSDYTFDPRQLIIFFSLPSSATTPGTTRPAGRASLPPSSCAPALMSSSTLPSPRLRGCRLRCKGTRTLPSASWSRRRTTPRGTTDIRSIGATGHKYEHET
jgi:hypothetical protein